MSQETFKSNVSFSHVSIFFQGDSWSGVISPINSEVFEKSSFSKYSADNSVQSNGDYVLNDLFSGYKSLDSEHELLEFYYNEDGYDVDPLLPHIESMIDPEGSAELAAKIHILDKVEEETLTIFCFVMGSTEFFLVKNESGFSAIFPPEFPLEGEYLTL